MCIRDRRRNRNDHFTGHVRTVIRPPSACRKLIQITPQGRLCRPPGSSPMSTSTVALTIEMPSLDASLSWNALESLVVGMSHEVPARALALALDDAQARLLVILGLSGKRRTDRLSLDLAELGTQMSFARAGRVDAELAGTSATAGQ